MKQRVAICVLIMFLVCLVSVFAVEDRAVMTIYPNLSIRNDTAYCETTIVPSSESASVSATVTLWYGQTKLTTWQVKGVGTTVFSETYSVSRSGTYQLSVDVTINGTTYSDASTTVTYRK